MLLVSVEQTATAFSYFWLVLKRNRFFILAPEFYSLQDLSLVWLYSCNVFLNFRLDITQLLIYCCKGPSKRGHIVADTLLPTKIFPRLSARATFIADTNFVSGTQKMFLILFRNFLCPQQMFPGLRSAAMCPRLPGPQRVSALL